MPRYAIAFHAPSGPFIHKVVELDSREAALRFFFQNHVVEEYTRDDEGYSYFLEDFNDPASPLGSVIEV